MLFFTSLVAFYLAWNLGANDVANSMGTSVGSKAVTLRQALVIAGVLEFTGAVLFGQQVSATIATQIANPNLFVETPQVLLMGMVAVLIACGVWLNIATFLGLPVSSSHAVVGAIAGFACIAVGTQAVDWQSLGVISLTWVVTPVVSGAIAALIYSQIKRWILDQTDPIAQLQEWIPWLSVALLAAFGVIVLPTLVETRFFASLRLPSHTVSLGIGAIAAIGLTLNSWRQLEGRQRAEGRGQEAEGGGDGGDNSFPTLHSLLPTPYLASIQNSKFKIQDSPPPPTLHPPPYAPSPEPLFARYQLLSACFVAFAHGSNDVGNAIAPLAAIAYIHRTDSVPLAGFQVPLWILVLGGIGIVAGLAVWGKKVIATIGEGIIPLQPSGGFCAELATAVTILVASRLGLPVSTSHALVGGVVGIGLVQNSGAISFGTLRSVGLAWVVTIPIAAALGAGIFVMLQFLSDFLN
ncbi:inorganic phosphate transporter [Kovacikia minuta CCNUW1]|uniref:inorganic phosphate transporter n=1 Tax=Kovacikia minuta TaxID=2931930 RepID=UPI001CCA4823|nr:inorganic phosphate transporter [Kovacikia minuta]UBF24065.1 inorganic phosphate transporter [Kovacikia minuta CCNUW1]